jgi:SAM-dependent methyltransferase
MTTGSISSLPVWTSLARRGAGGTHWKALPHDYVPQGLLEMLSAPPALVLDVGCFCGAAGAWLKRKYPGVRVVGIEPLAAAVDEARVKLDAVLQGRLEDVNLADAGIRHGTVDVIVLADVLEHMFDPWNALLKLRPLLNAGGVVLASIPNIRNLTILEQLAQGDFPYADSGLLDITHIRFFTWQGVQRLFGETGYRIDAVTRTLDSRSQSLLGALQQASPVNIDTPLIQLKNQTPDQVSELATLQFWLRASLVP